MRNKVTSHSTNGRLQVIREVEFNYMAAMQGVLRVLLLILPMPSGEWKGESTFGKVEGVEPQSVLIFFSIIIVRVQKEDACTYILTTILDAYLSGKGNHTEKLDVLDILQT